MEITPSTRLIISRLGYVSYGPETRGADSKTETKNLTFSKKLTRLVEIVLEKKVNS